MPVGWYEQRRCQSGMELFEIYTETDIAKMHQESPKTETETCNIFKILICNRQGYVGMQIAWLKYTTLTNVYVRPNSGDDRPKCSIIDKRFKNAPCLSLGLVSVFVREHQNAPSVSENRGPDARLGPGLMSILQSDHHNNDLKYKNSRHRTSKCFAASRIVAI